MKLTVARFPLLVMFMAVASGSLAQTPQKQAPKLAVPVKLTTAAVKTSEHVFKRTPQGELKLSVFQPADWKASDKRPGILFFFGGGWKHGTPAQFQPQAEYFAARGMVAACAEYRISSKHQTTPDKCIEDAKSAVRWLRSHAGELGLDPDRIIAAGGSAGGHLAAATALVPGFDAKEDDLRVSCKPGALVLFNPALNSPEFSVKDSEGKPLSGFWPTPFLSKESPPSIIFFGTADEVSQGREYLARAKELGCHSELYTAEGQPHGFFNRPPWLQVTTRQVDEFLTSLGYLTGQPTLESPPGSSSLKREE